MRVLVTGGAGYIGSVIVEELIKAGHFAAVYDSLERGHIDAVHPDARLICGFVQSTDQLTQVMQEQHIDAVIHMAAFIEVSESVQKPERYFYNNVSGSLSVLQAMISAGVKKIVFSSTAALYGDPQRLPITEDEPTIPVNPYGMSKLMVEQMLQYTAIAHSMTATSLRYFNAAGATERNGEMHAPETHLIPRILYAAQNGEDFTLFGTDYPTHDGTCVRDYIHVVDLAQAHLLALHRSDVGLKVYNVGNGNGYSNREIAEMTRKVTGRPLNIVEASRRPGDQIATVASSEKIRSELGWQPQLASLETILSSAWQWRLAHPNGYIR